MFQYKAKKFGKLMKKYYQKYLVLKFQLAHILKKKKKFNVTHFENDQYYLMKK